MISMYFQLSEYFHVPDVGLDLDEELAPKSWQIGMLMNSSKSMFILVWLPLL